ncbi:MAG: PspC domain-containing protein [Sphingobacteriaceae bacterium]
MEKKLYRNPNDRVLGGVAAGLARYFDIDVTWVRIIFILAAIFGMSGLFIYIILWIAVPEQPFNWNATANTDYRVKDETAPEPLMPKVEAPNNNRSRPVAGMILIFFGLFFLLREFDLVPYWFRLGKLWPLVFIIPGLVMLANAGRKEKEKAEETKPEPEDENPSIH